MIRTDGEVLPLDIDYTITATKQRSILPKNLKNTKKTTSMALYWKVCFVMYAFINLGGGYIVK